MTPTSSSGTSPAAPSSGSQSSSQSSNAALGSLFSSLEQEIQMRTDLDSINNTLTADSAAAQPPTSATTQS
jgi:hypothetical protein